MELSNGLFSRTPISLNNAGSLNKAERRSSLLIRNITALTRWPVTNHDDVKSRRVASPASRQTGNPITRNRRRLPVISHRPAPWLICPNSWLHWPPETPAVQCSRWAGSMELSEFQRPRTRSDHRWLMLEMGSTTKILLQTLCLPSKVKKTVADKYRLAAYHNKHNNAMKMISGIKINTKCQI